VVAIVGESSHVDVGRAESIVHGALSDVELAVVTRVLGLVETNVSLSPHVVDFSKILETNVGDGVVAIVGEGSQVDVGRSVSVVHGALSNIQHAVVTRVLGLFKSDVSLTILVVDSSSKILETNVGDGVVAIVGEGSHVDIGRSVTVVH